MAYNLNNLFPKPAIYRNSPVADQRLTVDGTAIGIDEGSFKVEGLEEIATDPTVT